MARVNLETRAFGEIRLTKLSKMMGWHRTTSIGVLAVLWHESQEALAVDATREQIVEWIDADADSGVVFDALLKAKYLSENEDGSFEIRGNRKHVEAMQKIQESGRLGGQKSGAARRAKNPPKIEGGPSTPEGNSIHSSSTQGSSSHSNSTHSNSDQPTQMQILPPDPSGPSPAELNREIWKAYSESYEIRYGAHPVRNAVVNAQIAQIGKRLGKEAPRVVEFYVKHKDAFYQRNMHSIGVMLKDCEKLRTEWVTGKQMLGSKARELERKENNSSNWDEGAKLVNDRIDRGNKN